LAKRFVSKSSQKIHPAFGVEHSDTTGDPVPPVPPVPPLPLLAAVTVTGIVVRAPLTVALTVVDPAATPVTSPDDDTVATAAFALAHVTVADTG